MEQWTVLQVGEVPLDMSPEGFLFRLFFSLLLSLFKHGPWRPIKTDNQILTSCFFVLKHTAIFCHVIWTN